MLELNIKVGLAYSRLQETILMIEDWKELGDFANVKNWGRTNLIFYQDSARYQDLTEDENLVQLFTEVLARRDELDKQS